MASPKKIWLLVLSAALGVNGQAPVPASQPRRVSDVTIQPRSFAQADPILMTVAQHQRLSLATPLLRYAVADPSIVAVQTVTSTETILLARKPGRTTVVLWMQSGEVKELMCVVQRDLTVLQGILTAIHSSIKAQIAPDRDAVVLSGHVPNYSVSQVAEAAATNYLAAREIVGTIRPLLRTDGSPVATVEDNVPNRAGVSINGVVSKTDEGPKSAATARELNTTSDVRVINLLTLEQLPASMEEKIQQAIFPLTGNEIRIRRIVHGTVPDDRADVFLLEGKVLNQVTLVRALALAAHVVTGSNEPDAIQIVADESGGLNRQNQASGGGSGTVAGGGSGGNAAGGGFGGTGNAGQGMMALGGGRGALTNLLTRNIARAKVLQAARGRILSFVEVSDLPQVRVDIRLFEVNRNRLKTYRNTFTSMVTDIRAANLNPSGIGQRSGTAPNVSGSPAVAEVLGFLGGTLSNQTQFTAGRFAVDNVFTLLENLGIARSLSSPSLTVLSGEIASFQVGGEIPVPKSYVAPIGGGKSGDPGGVFNSVEFVPFGVELGVRPLVGEDDVVMMDLLPSISTPNAQLTASIVNSTGSAAPTTAFQTRSLRTSARLQDGQAMLLGGLLNRDLSESEGGTPGLKNVAGLGWMFKNMERSDDGMELVIVVNPVIVREQKNSLPLWKFPDAGEMRPKITPAAVDGRRK